MEKENDGDIQLLDVNVVWWPKNATLWPQT